MVDKNIPEHENEFTQSWSRFEQIYGLEKVNWSFKKLAVYFAVPVDVLISCVQNNKELFPEYDRFSVSGMKEQAFDNNKAKDIARKLEYIQTGACLRPQEIKIFEE